MQELLYIIGPPAIAFAACFLLWLAFGRDTKIDRAVYPIYRAPEGLGVLECGILLDDVMNRKDLAYELYNLALNDIVKIGDDKYAYLQVSPESERYKSLTEGQQKLLEALFSHSYGRVQNPAMRLDCLNLKTSKIKKAVYDHLTAQGYYRTSPQAQRKVFYSFASLLMGGGIVWNIVMFFVLMEDWKLTERIYRNDAPIFIPGWLVLGLLLAGLVVGIFGSFMGRKTAEGVKKKLEIYGFREFIVTAERDRIEFFARTEPEQYKQVLPYAFLFGVGEQWAVTADDLARLSTDEHLSRITADMDPETIEEAFEEKKNIVFFLINLILKNVFEGIAGGINHSLSRNFDRNGEYRAVIDREFSGKMDTEKLLEFSAHLPPEARKRIVEKSMDDMLAGKKS
jgi:hypothetical protein